MGRATRPLQIQVGIRERSRDQRLMSCDRPVDAIARPNALLLTPVTRNMLHSTTSTGSYTLTKYSRSYPPSSAAQSTQIACSVNDLEWQHFVNPVMTLVLDIKKSTYDVLESVRLRILWYMSSGPDAMDIDQSQVVFVSNYGQRTPSYMRMTRHFAVIPGGLGSFEILPRVPLYPKCRRTGLAIEGNLPRRHRRRPLSTSPRCPAKLVPGAHTHSYIPVLTFMLLQDIPPLSNQL